MEKTCGEVYFFERTNWLYIKNLVNWAGKLCNSYSQDIARCWSGDTSVNSNDMKLAIGHLKITF